MKKNKIQNVQYFALLVLLMTSFFVSISGRSTLAEPNATTYNSDVASKLVTRCDLIKDYLSKTVRINELAARQNKVRGWEYILRGMDGLDDSYSKFNMSSDELTTNLISLRQQLEQFKVDFEAYDKEFQRLIGTDCKASPEGFWRQLETVRSFRAGIAISSENYKAILTSVISKEEEKW